MIIQHFANSFMKIEVGSFQIVCDPWVGTAQHGSWHSFPFTSFDDAIAVVNGCSLLYISHLHSDHLCEELLRQCNLSDLRIVIQKYSSPVLKRRLVALGAIDVIELEPWSTLRMEHVSVAIVPQIETTSSNASGLISYELDSSLLIHDLVEDVVFFNKVDNPLSNESLTKVREFSIETFHRPPDVACFSIGAASEYPQCFPGLDRDSERDRLIADSLTKFRQEFESLRPKIVFPAGGSYLLTGKRSQLNQYLATPNFDQIRKVIEDSPLDISILHLAGGGKLQIDSAGPKFEVTPEIDISESVIRELGNVEFEKIIGWENISESIFLGTLERARSNYLTTLSRSDVFIDWTIEVVLSDADPVDDTGNIKLFENSISLLLHESDSRNVLTLFLTKQSAYGAIKRKFSWNQILSGSHAMMIRNPNVYDPDVLFSMNYFVDSE